MNRPLTIAEQDEPTSRLAEPLRTLLRDFSDTAFACGEWDRNDSEATYQELHDEHVAAGLALTIYLLDKGFVP